MEVCLRLTTKSWHHNLLTARVVCQDLTKLYRNQFGVIMKRIMLSAIAISVAALASCRGDEGEDSTITFYQSSINGSAGGFNLSETVMSAGAPSDCSDLQTGGSSTAVASSNSFASGAVNCGGTNQTQLAYVVEVAVDGVTHSVTLNLNGHFVIPPDSLDAGLLVGTTGTVQSITEAFDGQTVFQIEGLDVDATDMTNALAGGDYDTFWHLLADGGGRSLDAKFSGSASFSVSCGSASIDLTSATTPLSNFLEGC
jgi:hypothetical protein